MWRRRMIVWIGVILLVSSSRLGAAEGAPLGWEPTRTWVFAVGLLEWKDPETWVPFPEARAGRFDERLVKFFRQAGVPDKQIVYLQDKQATLRRIQRELVEFSARPAKGDLLIVYFSGHGYWDSDTNRYYFANYDAVKSDSSDSWELGSLFKTLSLNFKGARVLLTADCCHSGGLVIEMGKRRWPFEAACLTSAYSHNLSTGSWTFSEALLKGFQGHPQLDLNDDGVVTLDETARFIEKEMAFVEGQKSMFAATPGFEKRLRLARAQGRRDERIGRHVEVRYQGEWYKARVLKVSRQGTEVQYVEDESTEVVPSKRIREYRPEVLPAGTRVKVEWKDGAIYKGRVKESWYGLHFIDYDGYGPEFDEWVSDEQLVMDE